MNVIFVSQCSRKALTETRRILDQFAERKGERTWQTAITQQGLITLHKLLRKSARRNTAVICHWIKSANRTEILWIVGSTKIFNEYGSIPTNVTQRNILRSQDENSWHTIESISLLSAIAGIFHDFGKANKLFQKKLKSNTNSKEPYRHEWVSLRLFEALVGNKTDRQWLEYLEKITPNCEKEILNRLIKGGLYNQASNPFKDKKFPPLAQAVGWLIVSHHHLPKYPKRGMHNYDPPPLYRIDEWLTRMFCASWNSPQIVKNNYERKHLESVWDFNKKSIPIASQQWCKKANTIASQALRHPQLLQEKNWLDDRFTSHLARLVLMLADHCYSAGDAREKWQDPSFISYANTDRKSGKCKQKLDEHNIAVGHYAQKLARIIPSLRSNLPKILPHKTFKKRTTHSKFYWQNKAYELAVSIAQRTNQQGFFGINMASTGCGKTYANARIMYGLSNENFGCRFNVALGLRTLTLQTGDALQERLQLGEQDLAVLIGSRAIQQLHDYNKTVFCGSESVEPLIDENQYVNYEGTLADGLFSHWLKRDEKLHKLISAPVVVSTIDYLIPATEGVRGGKQIAPMLRLLTSDLVLDEPDDFGLEDLPALTRLVNWAGMLGSRVLLSSATMPPALVKAMFEAYLHGRKIYNQSCIAPGVPNEICCAWFDEQLKPHQSDHKDLEDFERAHNHFIEKRVKYLHQSKPLRHAKLIKISTPSQKTVDVVESMADVFENCLYECHENHHQTCKVTSKQVSVGLIRMANINQMVAVAKAFINKNAKNDHCVHFCIYHSQHPLIVRSEMEKILDTTLTRRQPEKFWQSPSVANALNRSEKNQVFVVFATSVAEVGRDHDYDWAIVEPSSMRSLIQLAGRIQRHRLMPPNSPNLYILEKNFKALKEESIAYYKPGFESEKFKLKQKSLFDILEPKQYEYLSAIPRIKPRLSLNAETNLVDLEHAHLEATLFGGERNQMNASLWWRHEPTWCAEIQRRTSFRKSSGDDQRFILYMEDEYDKPKWQCLGKDGQYSDSQTSFKSDESIKNSLTSGKQLWMENNIATLLLNTSEQLELELADACKKFATIDLRIPNGVEKWNYHPWFGVYKTLD